jgi:hypothetical protein
MIGQESHYTALETPLNPFTTAASTPGNLQSRIAILTGSLTNDGLRETVAKVMGDLVFLLDYLCVVDGRGPFCQSEILSILHLVRVEACGLVDFIENQTAQLRSSHRDVHDNLDATAFAIKHELRRIFEGELVQATSEQARQKMLGALVHAQGVLTNCFQQCLLNLVRMFDETLDGQQLFPEWHDRRESSLLLCCELSVLIDLIQTDYEQSFEELDCIAAQLSFFREGSMQSLMYKDWEEYENLSSQVIASIENRSKPTALLHQLGCYLETLRAHVRARAVLADLETDSNYLDHTSIVF